MLSIIVLIVVLLSVIMLNVIMVDCQYVECECDDSTEGECQRSERHYTGVLLNDYV